jgi:hypothetical protein
VPFGAVYGAFAGFIISNRRTKTFPVHV